MEHEELTHQIIGCAYNVYNKLGFGFLESVYLNGLRRDIGLLLNFGPSGVEVKRKFRRPVPET